MSKTAKFVPEGGSSNRPPYLDGTDYYYWKGKMRLFLISQDNYMWPVVESGNFVPMTTVTPCNTPIFNISLLVLLDDINFNIINSIDLFDISNLIIHIYYENR